MNIFKRDTIMGIEEAKKILPEQMQAAIALLKKGTFVRSLISTALRGVIYIVIAVVAITKWTIRIEVFEMNILDKVNTVIANQNSDRAQANEARAEIKTLAGKVSYLEGQMHIKKNKE